MYRVRVTGKGELAYLGQSSNLRSRIGALKTLYRPEIPLSDPHTAAPCLWVMRTEQAAAFELSFCGAPIEVASRKGLECVAVTEYRELAGHSPAANFGRMPDGWIKSSGNNATVTARGGPFPGYQDPSAHRSIDHVCVLDRERDPSAPAWGGLVWSGWADVGRAPAARGVYRVKLPGADDLTYIGQGHIRDRLLAHHVKGGDPLHRQRSGFPAGMLASWSILDGTEPQQLLELECDLIASHVLWHDRAPAVQFQG